VNPEDVFRLFGKTHVNMGVGDEVYVIPPREPNESPETWAQRIVRVEGLVPDLRIDAVAKVFNGLSAAMQQFMKEAVTLLNSLWTLLVDVHDGDPDQFHHLTYQRLGHDAQCPVCEMRTDAPQEDGETTEGQGHGEGVDTD
jgi:hypothetical protein